MTAKQFLSQAFYLDRRIEKKDEEIARLRAKLEKSNSHISDMPRGGNLRDWTDTAVKVLELEERIMAEIAELCRVKRQIGEAIDAVEDARYRTLLELRYRNYYSFERIAVEMHYSYEWVRHVHKQALGAVTVPKTDTQKHIDL